MAEKITLVFVPGGWHAPSCYDAVIDHLQQNHRGIYTIEKVSLPSLNCPRDSGSMQAWQPDIEAIKSQVSTALTTTNTRVIAVSHSYGSLVSNEALGDLPLTNHPRLRHIIMCGFILPRGMSLRGSKPAGAYPPLWDVQGDVVYANDPVKHFYHDLPLHDQEKLARELKERYMPLV
jgi:hypothetical protein